MLNSQLKDWAAGTATTFWIAVVCLLAMSFSPVQANESTATDEIARQVSLGPANGLNFLLAAYPSVGTINQSRTVFMYRAVNCGSNDTLLDTSAMEAKDLVVLRKIPRLAICPTLPPPVLRRLEFVIAPTKAGRVTIRDEESGSEITIQTVPASPPSKFDTNGMWFDTATNGSGIALHHRRSTTDNTFGTWFLYHNYGESRWVSFQSANWQQDGSVLEGLLIDTSGGCQIPSLVACPASGTLRTDPPQDVFSVTPSLARITFQSATRAHAEVLTLSGAVLFTSELTKLEF
jgi:hypothetical protein